ncbi:hypothetical protein NL676_007351 [Syzygium grande]|nr:hypothetical protein NL676_007351 [Syzygium grande]
MMATLTATAIAAVASSSVAIRLFRPTSPSPRPLGSGACVIEGPAISQPRAARRGLVDCVVVGGGISGLADAQVLAMKHRDRPRRGRHRGPGPRQRQHHHHQGGQLPVGGGP